MEEKEMNGRVTSSTFTNINVVISLLVLMISSYYRYKFYPIFTSPDLGKLPAVTMVVFFTDWYIFVIIFFICIAFIIFKDEIREKWITVIVNSIYLFFLIIYILLFTISILSPIMAMARAAAGE